MVLQPLRSPDFCLLGFLFIYFSTPILPQYFFSLTYKILQLKFNDLIFLHLNILESQMEAFTFFTGYIFLLVYSFGHDLFELSVFVLNFPTALSFLYFPLYLQKVLLVRYLVKF